MLSDETAVYSTNPPMKIIFALFAAFLVWLIWATVTTGPMHELRQMNPDYPQPDKHVAYLVAELNREFQPDAIYPTSETLVQNCSLFMFNWEAAAECVRASYTCAYLAPKQTGFSSKYADIESDEFRDCKKKNLPTLGPFEMARMLLNGSRVLFRGAVFGGALRSVGMISPHDFDDYSAKETKHKWWLHPLMRWAEKGI